MRKVVAYELLSLDGVAEQPDEFVTDFDDEMEDNLARVIASQDAVLLGHRTYDEWAAFWPTSDIEPFASFINGVEKFVASSTTPSQGWPSSNMIERDLLEYVSTLKRRSGGDIGVHGSITLFQTLFGAGLVDELRLVVAPSVQMQGRKLFEKGRPTRLTLTRQLASPSGYLLLDFRVEG